MRRTEPFARSLPPMANCYGNTRRQENSRPSTAFLPGAARSARPDRALQAGCFSWVRDIHRGAPAATCCSRSGWSRDGAMGIYNLRINGRSQRVDVDPETPLLFVL